MTIRSFLPAPPALLLAAFASLLGVDAHAAYIRCEGCAFTMMRQAAIAAGNGTHTVFSLSTNEIQSFDIEVLGAGEPANAFPRPVSPEQAQEFALLRDFFLETNGTMKFRIEVPAGELDLGIPVNLSHWTVFDYAANPAAHVHFQTGVATYVRNTARFGTLLHLAGAMTSVTGSALQITVRFAGGGSARFQMQLGHTVAQQMEIRDSAGNIVPTPGVDPSTLSGLYHFPDPGAQRAFGTHLSNLGWPVDWGLGGHSQPGAFICTWDWLRANLVCKMVGRL